MKLIAAIFDKDTLMGVSGGGVAAMAPFIHQVGDMAQSIAQIVGLAIAIVILVIRLKEMKK